MNTSGNLNDKHQRLFAAAQAGDKEAFNELATLYIPELQRAAQRLPLSEYDAEEIAQDAMMKSFKAIKYFRNESSIRTWLHSITLNLAKSRYRKNRRKMQHESLAQEPCLYKKHAENIPAGANSMPTHQIIRQELSNLLIRHSQLLPPTLYTTLHLRYIMLLSYKEIADIMQCSPGTVKSRLHRARKCIKELIQKDLL